jgi:hypothetical protein
MKGIHILFIHFLVSHRQYHTGCCNIGPLIEMLLISSLLSAVDPLAYCVIWPIYSIINSTAVRNLVV